jgi:PAS domain S-box-containing protein
MERTDKLANTLKRLKRELKHRKLAEDALKESEERYRGLFDRSLDFVYVHDFEGNFIDANPAVLESFGYTKEEIYSIDFATLLSEDQIPAALKDIEEIAHTGFQRELKEYRLKRKDGTYVYLEIQGSLVYRDGKPYAIQGIARDITARKQAEEAVRESEEKFRNLFNNVEVGMFITRLDGSEILDMNEKFLNIFGRTREEMQGLASVIHWADPSEREEMLRILEIEGRVPNFECKMLNKQGEVRTCLASSRLYRDEGIMEGSILDITERKQAENKITASLKEKEVLLKEVHHRVKNNLQVISSLLNLQSRHITDKASRAMFKESQSRIRAMALIHEKLYTSEALAHIDIAEYMQDLTASLFSTYTVRNKIKVNIAITDIFLTITTAIPCGLIINELVTNALKHAFPHQQDGTITISMTPSTNDSLILTVSDTGIGFPKDIDFRNTTTLGMQLVTSLVEQLEGTITLDRSEGTRFRIEFRKQE